MQKYTLVPLLLIVVVFSFFLYGSNSSVQAITVPTPTLLSPGNQSNPVIPDNGVILLDWNTVNISGLGAAEKYEVEVIKEPSIETYNDGGVILYRKKGSSQQFDFTVTNSVSQLLLSSSNLGKNISHGDIYRWRVRACSLNCIFNEIGPWSEQRTFITKFKDPALTEPLNGRLVLFSPSNPVKFTWDGVASAEQYELNLVDTATGVNAITPTSTSQKEKKLDFSTFAYLIQKTFSWTIEPFVSGEREDYFSALQNLYPSDNIPSKSISAPENFTIRFMPPTEPIFPVYEAEVLETSLKTVEIKRDGEFVDVTGLYLIWDSVLADSSNTIYQVKKPDGPDSSEEFVSSNTLAISAGELCELQTWEVRSCNENGTNCGPYPSHASIKNAYPLNNGIQQGPWEFTIIPTLTVSNFHVFPYVPEGEEQQEQNMVRITAEIGGTAPGDLSINFGDGKTEFVTITDSKIDKTHRYSSSGKYTITIGRSCAKSVSYEEVNIDVNAPTVSRFNASPDYPAWVNAVTSEVVISWDVRDRGDSFLKRFEVFRTGEDNGGNLDEMGWKPIEAGSKLAPLNSNRWKCSDTEGGCLTDFPPEGTYWYGLHVLDKFGEKEENDKFGNLTYEPYRIKIQVDKSVPTVESFDVQPIITNSNVTISWEVSDKGDSNLKQVEVWKADFTDSCSNGTETACSWNKIRAGTKLVPTNLSDPNSWKCSDIEGGCLTDSSSEGTYWYGLHVLDNADNMVTEGGLGPIKVQVDKTLPECSINRDVTSIEVGDEVIFSVGDPNDDYRYKWNDEEEFNKVLNFEKTFTDAGGYEVRLTVIDSAENSKSCTVQVEVSVLPDDPTIPPDDSTPPPDDPTIPPDDPTIPPDVISATPGVCQLYCEALSTDDAILPPDGTTCICNPLSSVKFSDIFGRIVNFLLNVALVVAPIALVASGFMFITAGGNPEQIIRARSIIIWTVVGVIVILLSKGLMNVLGGIIGI